MSEIGSNDSAIRDHRPTGASTGFMWELRGDWTAQIDLASSVSTEAIELSALAESEVLPLLEFLRISPPLGFGFTSIHGPSKGRDLSSPDLVGLLLELVPFCDGIVMHPDSMGEFEPYEALGAYLLIENMDARKGFGRTVPELAACFDLLPEARLCFDIAHAWSIDPTMTVANEILDAFGDRLSHVHLSSLSEQLHHIPLTPEHMSLFAPTLSRCQHIPWILEAPPPNF